MEVSILGIFSTPNFYILEVPSQTHKKKYGTVQELRSTFNHIKSINIDSNLVWFVTLYVDLSVCMWARLDTQKKQKKT